MENKTIKEVDHYIEATTKEFQEILIALRKIILSSHPDIIEEFKWNMPNYAYNGLVCYLQATKKHVKLGFHRGNELEDNGLFVKSTAKTMRHIQMTSMEELDSTEFQELLQKAVRLNSN